jgi:hypothetical protein
VKNVLQLISQTTEASQLAINEIGGEHQIKQSFLMRTTIINQTGLSS